MTKKTVVLADLIQQVRKVAEERPDFVYDSKPHGCWYTLNGDPNDCGCIVGVAIHRLYPELWEKMREKELIFYPRTAVFFSVPTFIPNKLSELGYSYVGSPEELRILSGMQSVQDNGFPWGIVCL